MATRSEDAVVWSALFEVVVTLLSTCSKNQSDDAELLSNFRAAAVDYGEALEMGDHKSANKAARLGGKLKKEIVAWGDRPVETLVKLLDDGDPVILGYATQR
jgi:hypothetical protein